MKLFLFAFLGWTFDFYDLVLFGFIKDHVSHDLGLSHSSEAWLLGVALSLIASYGLMRLVDPAVNRMRNLIRGKSLEPAEELPLDLGRGLARALATSPSH